MDNHKMDMSKIFDNFWDESIWLPPNITWKDVEPRDGLYTNFYDLWYPLPIAAFIVVLRSMVERHLFKPLGLSLGIKDSKHVSPAPHPVLEREFNASRRDKQHVIDLQKLSADLKMSRRQIEYWLKRRRLQGKPTTLVKFCETGWRWLYYSAAFIYGIVVLWDKPWLWNIQHCWYDYPHHEVPGEVWWYYMVELAFYWSLSISQFVDVKRKDFVEMLIHHITTIALLCFSWTCNLTRCGTLVLVIHDFSDIFLEFAKLCNYTKFKTTCDIIFSIFAVSWIVTRLGIFPVWILYSIMVEAPQLREMFPAYYIFNGLLSVLLVLHVVWTYFILKIAYIALTQGKDRKQKDSRSESEETCSTSSDEGAEERTRQEKACSMKSADQNGAGSCNGLSPGAVSCNGLNPKENGVRQRMSAQEN